jgi:hypothetical protein
VFAEDVGVEGTRGYEFEVVGGLEGWAGGEEEEEV